MGENEAIATLQAALLEAAETIQVQSAMLNRLLSGPLVYGVVISSTPADIVTEEDFVPGAKLKFIGGDDAGLVLTILQDAKTLNSVHATEGPRMLVRTSTEVMPRYFSVQKALAQISAHILVLEGKSQGAVMLSVEGKIVEVQPLPGVDLNPGDVVKVNMESLQIVDKSSRADFSGPIVMVTKVIDNTQCEIGGENEKRIIFTGRVHVKEGDRIVVDPAAQVALKNLGAEEDRFTLGTNPNVDWSQIGGLDDQIRELKELVLTPILYPDLFEGYGQSMPKGALLIGPPRCGKTLLAKALATEIAKLHADQGAKGGFFAINGSELLDKWLGNLEAALRHIYRLGREFYEKHGIPAVLFFDEIDGLALRRGSGISSNFMDTAVPMLLSLQDGIAGYPGMVSLYATNRADQLDSAVIDYGRINVKILVPRPTLAGGRDIFTIHTQELPFQKGEDVAAIRDEVLDSLYAGVFPVCEVVFSDQGRLVLDLKDIVSGGMLEGLVSHAKKLALRRDIVAGAKCPTGMVRDDFVQALHFIHEQEASVLHVDAVQDIVPADMLAKIVSYQKLPVRKD